MPGFFMKKVKTFTFPSTYKKKNKPIRPMVKNRITEGVKQNLPRIE